ncbi:hypothetical protein K450DRAFT_253730 [Umbelopsis ramanniana AG]|uniref:Uncharacterized protein n=1 Tax=Umbelopsis ramanniana AG TaxID=1314678 RepID=A0AAD5E5M8_UMBRA|nr:uncharacterized protein K450DRAFT_253730 [Umbelopsis ramanniana AG]KAI8577114.1 hypothetical protein K450DRAFT_253730 [Umbelopsis ramanniana AG]
MSAKPISFTSTDNKPSSTTQHLTFGPFSAPEHLPPYSPPTARQLHLTSPPTSPGGNWFFFPPIFRFALWRRRVSCRNSPL